MLKTVIHKQKLILTNYHVIEGAQTIQVVFDDGATVSATVAGSAGTLESRLFRHSLDARKT